MLLLGLASCSAGYRRTPPNGEEPHEELANLQKRIVVLRYSLQMESTSDPERCRKMGTIAAEICRCADRICVLAEDLAEDAARLACAQAREDCQRSRSNADSCK
jgi:hypothetical protein